MKTEHFKCDVLCVGGGIGGLMAAIRAAELGAKVIVAEKGNVIHSGKGGGGCDHYLCYIPEVHGPDMDAYIEEMLQTQQAGNFQNLGMKRIRTHIARTFDIIKLWDSWGIPTKQNGKYYFAGHAFPGGYRCLLKYEGLRQKPILVEQARKRKVKIVNRVMVFDLIADGRVAGAIGIDTREQKIITFEAKSVILGTGGTTRLYPSVTPGWISNNATRISLTGDGRMMAYRAGRGAAGSGDAGAPRGAEVFRPIRPGHLGRCVSRPAGQAHRSLRDQAGEGLRRHHARGEQGHIPRLRKVGKRPCLHGRERDLQGGPRLPDALDGP